MRRTRWRRFAAILAPSIVGAAVLTVSVAQGALAASFFISGETFKIAADSLTGKGMSVYGMVNVTRKGRLVPVTVTGVRDARIDALCLSIRFPIPVLGTYTLRLTGDHERPATARDMFFDVSLLKASEASLKNLDIGVAAGSLTSGEVSPGDRDSKFFDPNSVAMQSTSIIMRNLRVNSVAASLGSLDLPGAQLKLTSGAHECF
ncbi:hypothetical protein BIV25_07960 [Streptomyces sp. MUSC 14]|uniref:DUF6230 family protein n=1 Tax=Streptomyces sp. MUSC 14 TaxID=1354889 RepID=UPI0008F592CC|nr:DUF6230 family protein [Streptomyces sp. MUSC 14]OIK00403.1 hypothetical protein BIV25_07960 [Streptomyces sp. MUSC 14]